MITINNETKQLSFIYDDQHVLRIGCENYQYRIFVSNTLKNHPETLKSTGNDSIFETGEVRSPLYGKILEISVKKNQRIKKDDLLLVIEAMKSENRILSPQDGTVKEIAVKVGDQVIDQMPLIFLNNNQ